jgi:hypothetical protein
MSVSDYLLDSILILLVVRQLRTSRYDRRAWLLPLVIVAVVGKSYLHGVPTDGNNLLLVAGLTVAGVLLGSFSALATRVWSDGGRYALVKAGAVSAALWVLGMGGRMAFAIWASSDGGATSIGRFSLQHGLDPNHVWTAALVLMALGEVISRVGILALRAHRAQQDFRATPAAPLTSYAVRG